MNYVEGDFGTMAESGASGPSDYQEHKRVMRADMAAASKAYLPQYADGPDGLKALLACVSAPTDPRDAEIQALRIERDTATKPLHAEIERLKAELADERKANSFSGKFGERVYAQSYVDGLNSQIEGFKESLEAAHAENAALCERLAAAEGEDSTGSWAVTGPATSIPYDAWRALNACPDTPDMNHVRERATELARDWPGLRHNSLYDLVYSKVLERPEDPRSTALSRALSLPNTTDAYGR